MIPTLTWLGLAALIVGGIVRLLKTDAMNNALAMLSLPPVPAWLLPWAALFFGAASGVIAALVKGTAWPDAIAQGLGAGATAVLGHEIVIEGMRGGKEIGASSAPKMPPFAGGLLLVLCMAIAGMALTLTGCTSSGTPPGESGTFTIGIAFGVFLLGAAFYFGSDKPKVNAAALHAFWIGLFFIVSAAGTIGAHLWKARGFVFATGFAVYLSACAWLQTPAGQEVTKDVVDAACVLAKAELPLPIIVQACTDATQGTTEQRTAKVVILLDAHKAAEKREASLAYDALFTRELQSYCDGGTDASKGGAK